jgi:hypothetical protein
VALDEVVHNETRYVGNDPTNATDPTGLINAWEFYWNIQRTAADFNPIGAVVPQLNGTPLGGNPFRYYEAVQSGDLAAAARAQSPGFDLAKNLWEYGGATIGKDPAGTVKAVGSGLYDLNLFSGNPYRQYDETTQVKGDGSWNDYHGLRANAATVNGGGMFLARSSVLRSAGSLLLLVFFRFSGFLFLG